MAANVHYPNPFANPPIFGAQVQAPAISLVVTKPALWPTTSDCRQVSQHTLASKDASAKPLSVSRTSGDLYLEFESRYKITPVVISNLTSGYISLQHHSFLTKLFPAGPGCQWPEKPEVVVTLSITPSPPYNGASIERVQCQQVCFNRCNLSLTVSNAPIGYKAKFTSFEVKSTDQRSFAAFCESVDGLGSTSVSAGVDLRIDGQLSLSFGLRLVAIAPHRNAFEETKSLASRLLSSASVTGDVMLRTQGGTELPAHKAALSELYYFNARFGPDWRREPEDGDRSVCMLPVEVNEEGLATFLSYVYGEPHSLDTIKSPAVLQALFSLGEACDLPALCEDVARATRIQDNEVEDWIDWLGKEHVAAVEPIREQMAVIVKQTVLAKKDVFWEHLSMEELSHFYNAAKRHKKDS